MKIDINALRLACTTKTSHFKKILKYDSKEKYWFKDNGGSVLAVAHLDSVQQCTHFHEMHLPHKHRVYCPVLDDRLGVYIILNLLPKLGLKYDILLTTDEEIGRSTAQNFSTTKQYNWIFEFDRKGDDVVMYDYETKEMKENLEKVGWKVGRGSYSDISELEFLECKAFNFGTGYQDYHSLDAYVDLKVLAVNIQKFFLFFNKFKDVHLPHKKVEKKWNWRSGGWRDYDYGDDYGYTTYNISKKSDFKCPVCGGSGWIGGKICANCEGDGWVGETQVKATETAIVTTTEKKIVSMTSEKCLACNNTGVNSKGNPCICKKKSTILPTHSDLYTYSCLHCHSYNEIDLETSSDEAIAAAEENVCVKCARTITYFT